MATVIVYPADLSPPRIVPVDRRVISFGADRDNDIHLAGGDASDHHAHILYEGKQYTLSTTDGESQTIVNGRQRKTHKLSDGDIIRIGDHIIRFVLYDQGLEARPADAAEDTDGSFFRAYRRFSEVLLENFYAVPALLETMLDELIALTSADRAFLMLVDEGSAKVRVARNIDQSTLESADVTVSDTIVKRVLETGQALILADALSHQDFKTSRSVVDLKLCSVMCVPLKARGSTLGLFYLGNDNAINQFGPRLLEIVGVFASTAALILADALQREELAAHVQELEEQADDRRFGEIIGACDQMRDLYKKVSRVATTDIPVLIEGETGSGKELIAKAVHEHSNRAKGPFVVINCGAIPENLLESELFGHVRGAFTGAVTTQQGRFQAADGGTLFLDEIGEMPLALQVKILRAVETLSITKVGDTRAEKIDVRFVAATNRNLLEEVQNGRFRQDLFYRLNVITLSLPPLRDRGDDILLITNYFLKRYGQELAGRTVTLSSEAIQALNRWRWPGNIRELDNRIKKAVVFSDSGVIRPDDLDLGEAAMDPVMHLADARDVWQRDYINRALALNDGNRTKTARQLDVDPRTIFRHLERERDEG